MKTTSKMKKTSKTPNPPKAQACMKTSLHEDNLHYAGLHTALDIFRFAVFLDASASLEPGSVCLCVCVSVCLSHLAS